MTARLLSVLHAEHPGSPTPIRVNDAARSGASSVENSQRGHPFLTGYAEKRTTMTTWWGILGLLGLLGGYGLLRIRHRSSPPAGDAFARYPAMNEPAVPNADAAHTPLMNPAITPGMLDRGRRRPRRAARSEGGRRKRTPPSSTVPPRQNLTQPHQRPAMTQATPEPAPAPNSVPVAETTGGVPPSAEKPARPAQGAKESGSIAGKLATPQAPERRQPIDSRRAKLGNVISAHRPRLDLRRVLQPALLRAKKFLRRK